MFGQLLAILHDRISPTNRHMKRTLRRVALRLPVTASGLHRGAETILSNVCALFHIVESWLVAHDPVWDMRSMKKPTAVVKDIANLYSETNLCWSPDDRSVLTGLGAKKGEKGSLVFLNGDTLAEERRTTIGEGSVVRVLWHSRINQVSLCFSLSVITHGANSLQIFASLSTGAIHVLYSPHSSLHGALLPLAKMPRSTPRDVTITSSDLKPVIYTPDALPMYADQTYRESLHQREKRAKKMRPQEPVSGIGRGGRVGASAMTGFVQTIFSDTLVKEDPREALLKYAEKKDEE